MGAASEGMYAISLTSIPPRLPRIGPVLQSLCTQMPPPDAVYLCLPETSRRFGAAGRLPALPGKVSVLWSETDFGPATKALVAARRLAGSDKRLLYCDDDWIYPPHWASALLAAGPTQAVTGQAWDIARIGRKGTGYDVAQGFAGVSINPDWLADAACTPPTVARPVDDIWLSGHLARQGIGLSEAKAARPACSRPMTTPTRFRPDLAMPRTAPVRHSCTNSMAYGRKGRLSERQEWHRRRGYRYPHTSQP